MARRTEKEPDLSCEEEEAPGIGANAPSFRMATYRRGITQFSTFSVSLDEGDPRHAAAVAGARVAVGWEGFSELTTDHGIFAALGVMSKSQAEKISEEEALSDIRSRVDDRAWGAIMTSIAQIVDEEDEENQAELRRTFVRALWSDLFENKFSAPWLAAMALHAYYVKQDDYAFGYLIAELEQQQRSEPDYLRGKGLADSAKRGGQAKSATSRARVEAVLDEIRRFISLGHSAHRAAELAHQSGFGASPTANSKLWHRHAKKS